jgi:signal transduction histidine kinase
MAKIGLFLCGILTDRMCTRKAFLFLWLWGFVFLNVVAQVKSDDSLEQRLNRVDGKEKVDLLNALTYKFITQDNAKVLDYNQRALDLSKQINYLAGEARAYTYRGVSEYLSGQLVEGHRDLNRGLRLATEAEDESLRGYIFLQLGNCSLEEVQMDSALIFFKQSRAIFKDSTDPATLSKIYRNLSALYGQRYQIDSQQIYLDRAIRIRRLLPDKALLIEALSTKANMKLMVGDFTAAQELVDEATKFISTREEDDENRNDIRRIQALILFQKGEFDQASVLFDSARSYFLEKRLLRKYVTLLIDLGRIFSQRGDYELALNNLYDALKISQMQRFDADASIIRMQIGWVNHHLGNPEQALLMVSGAMRLSPKKLLRGDLANGLTLKGVALTDMKRFPEARACLDSVLQIYREFGSYQGMSETFMNLGYLELQREQYSEAVQQYSESISLAERIPDNYVLAWSYWGRGHAALKLGDFRNAVIFLDTSIKYANLSGSSEVIVSNYNTRRDLLTAQNRYKEALRFSVLANQLKDSLRRSDIARRFLSLERIQQIEQRNRDIRNLQQDKLIAENKIQLQEDKLERQSILMFAGLIGLLMLAVLALIYYRFYARIKTLNVSITEKNTRIQAQANRLQEVNVELNRLYQEVSEQKKEIQIQTDKLSESNKNILEMNRGLEKMVAEKTVELRKINTELIKKNSELFQFSYTVSHNLRGPVARLLGLVDLAEKENISQQAKQLIHFITKTAFELDQIVDDLIKILELRNEPQQHRETVSLEDAWRQTVGLLRDSLTGNEEISMNFEALPEITTVRSLLQNILYNLLSNAIKFRSPERRLKVLATSRSQDGSAILEVADNGLGFNIDLHQEKVFKLYRRFHAHVGGRGVGLYLIKTQVEVLHGSVEATSQPNKGSMFRIILPLSPEEHLV